MDEYNHALKALIYSVVHNFGYAHAQERRVGTVTRRNKGENTNPNPLAKDDNIALVRRR